MPIKDVDFSKHEKNITKGSFNFLYAWVIIYQNKNIIQQELLLGIHNPEETSCQELPENISRINCFFSYQSNILLTFLSYHQMLVIFPTNILSFSYLFIFFGNCNLNNCVGIGPNLEKIEKIFLWLTSHLYFFME